MEMERFDDDLNIIAGLGDDPKRDDGLSTQGFKSIFDKAGLLIQNFINNKLIPYIEKQNVGLPLGGGTMEGPINMNGQKLSGLNAPTADDEAANKGYVDNLKPNLTGYATETYVGDAITNRTVNDFTTTEEGYVADARALKFLNENKASFELLWENASPWSEFSEQQISINGIGDRNTYPLVLVITKNSSVFLDNDVDNWKMAVFLEVQSNAVYFHSREYTIPSLGILKVGTNREADKSMTITERNSQNQPWYIYGIKGVIS